MGSLAHRGIQKPTARWRVPWLPFMPATWLTSTTCRGSLTHGELHSEHILLRNGQPYFIDWATALYAPFYLVLYFTPDPAGCYRDALAAEGVHVPRVEFMDRYREMGRYDGFKWLCSGIWQCGSNPTEQTGRRLLPMIAWAPDGQWPDQACLLADTRWHRLLADHQR